jgi:Ser/Thr protein kinase RdoA (MazF antagonist)
MVFPWLPGTTLPPAPAPPDAARQIGALLGRLHALAPDVSGLEPPTSPRFSGTHWADLARQAREDGAAWAGAVENALPELSAWSADARAAQQALGNGWTATHRDMDQKNVLWSDPHTPNLLDWEEAGAMLPALEVMGTALNWAGQAAGPPVETTFAAFLNGYGSAAPLDRAALRQAAVAVLNKWLIWLDFNLVRSLRGAGTPPDEQATACGAAEHTLTTLRALAADTPRRLAWCDQAAPSSDVP